MLKEDKKGPGCSGSSMRYLKVLFGIGNSNECKKGKIQGTLLQKYLKKKKLYLTHYFMIENLKDIGRSNPRVAAQTAFFRVCFPNKHFPLLVHLNKLECREKVIFFL